MNKHGSCSHLCVVTSLNESSSKSHECSCPLGLIMSDHQCVNLPVCSPEQFICNSLNGECMPSYWRCDGQTDCVDGSDEVNCVECNEYQFKCTFDGHCIGVYCEYSDANLKATYYSFCRRCPTEHTNNKI